jgi:hypothetical protein
MNFMNRRYVGLIVAQAIVIMLLLIGVVVSIVLLNKPASLSSLPVMPTYDPVFSTTMPVSIVSPSLNIKTPSPSSTPALITPAQTALPLFILSRTPVSATSSYNYSTRITSATPTPISVTVWTYTPTPFTAIPPVKTCRNILYPMAAGQQWMYKANALDRMADLNMNVLSVNNSQGNVLVNNQSTGSTKQVQVQCDGDVIRSFPFMNVDVLFGNSLNSNMTASYVSGVLAPNEAAFLKNNWALAWSSQYLVSGNTAINRNGAQLSISFNNTPVTLNCQTLAAGEAAFETVTVTAGTFRALKVACSEQGQVTANMNGVSIAGQAEGRSYQWFAPNIGLVKMQVDYAAVKIFDVSFSLLTNNYLELKSYIAAP